MASSPAYKIFHNNEYIASVKYLEDAAEIMLNDDMKIRRTEGKEEISALETYDRAAEIMRIKLT